MNTNYFGLARHVSINPTQRNRVVARRVPQVRGGNTPCRQPNTGMVVTYAVLHDTTVARRVPQVRGGNTPCRAIQK